MLPDQVLRSTDAATTALVFLQQLQRLVLSYQLEDLQSAARQVVCYTQSLQPK